MAIRRNFNSTADAQAAASDLKEAGFRDAAIHIATLHGGVTEVRVDAALGAGGLATSILERKRSGDTGSPKAVYDSVLGKSDISQSMSTPVILWHDPAPFSGLFSLPLLWRAGTSFGLPLLSDSHGPYNSTFGLSLLSDNPTPLSSVFKLPLLLNS